jgi:hypothetical protein
MPSPVRSWWDAARAPLEPLHRPSKGSNKKGSNKKGGNNGLDVKSDNKIGTNKKGSRTPKNDGSRSSNKKGGGGDK